MLSKQIKDSLDYIESFGHLITPLDGGIYYILWVNGQAVEVNAKRLIEISNEIYKNETGEVLCLV